MAEMGKYAQELAGRRILRRGAPLAAESEAACVRVRDGKTLLTDGPFAEAKEVIAGFWIVDVPSREAALEVAARCPHARHSTVQVHELLFRGEFGDSERGVPFLLVFRMEPGADADGAARGREMREFGEGLVCSATLFETGLLANRVVTDGPYAESKEVIGGYAWCASPTAPASSSRSVPARALGTGQVRVLFFDRV
jgi:hypothetical protein